MTSVLFKSKPTPLFGSIPSIGSQAPGFSLTAKDLTDVTLESFGNQMKVIYTAPSLDTPVCLTSTKKLSEEIGKKKNTSLLVVTADLPFAQVRVCGAEHVTNVHTLSLMHSRSFARDYGVEIADGPLRGLCARAIFVLDSHNKIIHVELVKEITEEPDYEKVLSIL